jgi:hypothetical protein
LEHPDDPRAFDFNNGRELCLCGNNYYLPHKKTLFHTVAHFRGCAICGQGIFGLKTRGFFNKVKDLAHLIEAQHREISPIN